MKDVTFYICEDNKTHLVNLGDSPAQCRGEGLKLLEANTVDAAAEKHVPVAKIVDGKLRVSVGSVAHPMQPEHFIEWIFVQTRQGGMYHKLAAGQEPQADFPVAASDVVGVYAYCNLHGLWKAALDSADGEFHETVCSAEFKECIES